MTFRLQGSLCSLGRTKDTDGYCSLNKNSSFLTALPFGGAHFLETVSYQKFVEVVKPAGALGHSV